MTITTVLFDLDGVIRHFDPDAVAEIERRHGIDPGTIESFAFAAPLLQEVTTGKLRRTEWVDRIAEHLGNPAAAEEWSRQPYRVDAEVVAIADQLRAAGLRTAILTNGTDTIPAEAEQMRLHDHFEAVFNSAEIGHAKPDARAFHAVLDDLDVGPHEVFFTDDSPGKLVGATYLGIRTHHYEGITGLRRALAGLGILTRSA
ncbi:HAD family phosphatase [Microbacterium sp.]|uniref:HAD family hydrolase n=1 Tax=Microbacterium sp. TaxID=51671 RepID=UPI002736ABBC|nr:HAD family phosphatase [Microbacterium sp.]MDP3953173.1 HAD family phosphatase [Microbacterium sp.]